ncbi:MAG: sigma-70 family RNA polymerase sigma factor [Planctomycetales bacterium]|nr:sigma-70 family RNA polymerase sigma factor [Planctomycetales bacterium]
MSSHNTRTSLLIRIKDPRNTQAWAEFHDLYAPLLYRYARARGLSHDDAEDVRSTCYEAIVKQIPHFDYDSQRGGFKAWLQTLVSRRVIDLMRKRQYLTMDSGRLVEVPAVDATADQIWEEHWRKQHLRHCMEQAGLYVSQQSYQAFRLLVEEQCSVSDICERLGMNANQVYKAKAQMLATIRELMQASED